MTENMTDEQLLSYAEIHCRTERALFHSSHLNRILALAGHPPAYVHRMPEGFHPVGADTMDDLVALARADMAKGPKIATVADLVAYLLTVPQDAGLAYSCCSEQTGLTLDRIELIEGCAPRPDGWIQNARPDKPSQFYVLFPGN